MTVWWPDQGTNHSQDMLARELGYLGRDFRTTVITSDPVGFAQRIAERSHYLLFEVSGFEKLMHWISRPPAVGEQGVRLAMHRGYTQIAEFVVAAMQVTQVFSVRLAVLTLAMPVFLLFGLIALVDGLVRRDLRRWGGGRESSFVYHYAKKAGLPMLVVTWVVYLALPFSLHPTWIVLPLGVLFGLSVTVTAGTFKKYL